MLKTIENLHHYDDYYDYDDFMNIVMILINIVMIFMNIMMIFFSIEHLCQEKILFIYLFFLCMYKMVNIDKETYENNNIEAIVDGLVR